MPTIYLTGYIEDPLVRLGGVLVTRLQMLIGRRVLPLQMMKEVDALGDVGVV